MTGHRSIPVQRFSGSSWNPVERWRNQLSDFSNRNSQLGRPHSKGPCSLACCRFSCVCMRVRVCVCVRVLSSCAKFLNAAQFTLKNV